MDIIKQGTNKVMYKATEATYDPKAEAAALQNKVRSAQQASYGKSNVENYTLYRSAWGARAVASNMIDPKYFRSYDAILNAPVPFSADVDRSTYDSAIEALATVIKKWYVDAKYRGDLNELRQEIDATRPKYVVTQGVAEVKPATPPPTATDEFMKGFLRTLGSTILILFAFFVCFLAGSLAANDAIGRSPFIRFVYFIYGAIPFYTPFVLIYYLYRYFKGTYPLFYNFLPLTTYLSPNLFLSTLLWPFYYIKDANSEFQKNEYDRLGSLMVWLAEAPSAPAAKNVTPSAPAANNATPPAPMANNVTPSAPAANNVAPAANNVAPAANNVTPSAPAPQPQANNTSMAALNLVANALNEPQQPKPASNTQNS